MRVTGPIQPVMGMDWMSESPPAFPQLLEVMFANALKVMMTLCETRLHRRFFPLFMKYVTSNPDRNTPGIPLLPMPPMQTRLGIRIP